MLKCIFYIIPAIIIGNYTDVIIIKIKEHNLLGNYTLNYILLQTFIIISTLYLIIIFSNNYTNEFQITIAGAFFIVLYFEMQTNYKHMIKDYISRF